MNYLTEKKTTLVVALLLPIVCLLGTVTLLTTSAAHRVIAQTQPKTAAKPNFTGVWKLNLTESKLPDGKPAGPIRGYKAITISLIHIEPEIAFGYDIKDTRPGLDRMQSYIITTDGKERQIVLGGSSAVAWAKWEGDSLIVYHKRTTGTDSNISTRRSFTLSEDGKTLKSVPKFTARNNGKDVPDYGGETEIWERQ
jgi:hypothetical protein